jgi:hypothetical protein
MLLLKNCISLALPLFKREKALSQVRSRSEDDVGKLQRKLKSRERNAALLSPFCGHRVPFHSYLGSTRITGMLLCLKFAPYRTHTPLEGTSPTTDC